MAAEKYPRPITPAAPLTLEFDSYSYATVFGWSVARDRVTQRWCVRAPDGRVAATSSSWLRAVNHALERR